MWKRFVQRWRKVSRWWQQTRDPKSQLKHHIEWLIAHPQGQSAAGGLFGWEDRTPLPCPECGAPEGEEGLNVVDIRTDEDHDLHLARYALRCQQCGYATSFVAKRVSALGDNLVTNAKIDGSWCQLLPSARMRKSP